ncbi:MAG TPA: amino acid ABC transporter permease [Acidimicrobiales bacterium]|nr:amino acid ABC transporter permease [Acidimicrobiales bacterium]
MGVIFDNLDAWAEGLRTTVSLTLWSWALAFALGVLVAVCRIGPVLPLRAAGTTYVELVRNCPLTVLFVLFFFGLPEAGIIYPRFASAVIVLGIYTSAFVAEVVRAGVNTVATGQAEAARSIGLTFGQVLRHVVLPQALRAVISPMGGLFVALIRNSSIAYTISVVELSGTFQRIGIRNAELFPALIAVATIYLALTLPSGWVINRLERRYAVQR